MGCEYIGEKSLITFTGQLLQNMPIIMHIFMLYFLRLLFHTLKTSLLYAYISIYFLTGIIFSKSHAPSTIPMTEAFLR